MATTDITQAIKYKAVPLRIYAGMDNFFILTADIQLATKCHKIEML